MDVAGVSALVGRTGYTGELGFELYVRMEDGARLWERLLDVRGVEPAGLGARNTLRLEVGYPLYGHELDEATTPVEARLEWALPAHDEYCGATAIRRQRERGPERRLGGILTQGALEVLHDMGRLLCEITGMAEFTMQPLAGAHGELTGAMLIAAYHRKQGNRKTKLIIPDSGHGTNPASAAIAGYDVVVAPTNERGVVGPEAVRGLLDDEVAGMMLTCPNTLGLFNREITQLADLIHEVDGLMYYDGANLNAILGRARPGDMGFDIVHLNLHKTFGTPHGGGGPGAGPVGVVERLLPFLPSSVVTKRSDGTFALDYGISDTIGYVAPFYGNFAVILRAYAYILRLGRDGLRDVADNAVLNANYVLNGLRGHYEIPYDRPCMHEFVLSASRQKAHGVSALDIAKALIDRGIHPPTAYFPLIVAESLMVDPTETENQETLDAFVNAMVEIARLAQEDPESPQEAPHLPITRLDEVAPARDLDVCSQAGPAG